MLLRVKTLCLTVNSSTKLKMQVFLYAVKLHVISSLAAYPADILKAAVGALHGLAYQPSAV